LIDGVHVDRNSGFGIVIGGGTVTRCTVTSNLGHGIATHQNSTVSLNTVALNTGDGIIGAATVSNNTVRSNGQDGIFNASLAVNNTVVANKGADSLMLRATGGM
jgi:hypothetical protein